MDFRILGPLAAAGAGGPLALPGGRQRALLAFLLLHPNEVVPRSRLIDALWGEQPPERAANAVQVHVHGLRRLLGRERVLTSGPGYLLRVEPGELDLHRFLGLVERARDEDDRRAAATLREALALWRGPALAELAGAPFAAAEAARLEELRVGAEGFARAHGEGEATRVERAIAFALERGAAISAPAAARRG